MLLLFRSETLNIPALDALRSAFKSSKRQDGPL